MIRRPGVAAKPVPVPKVPKAAPGEDKRRGRLTVTNALAGDDERTRSVAAFRRRRQTEQFDGVEVIEHTLIRGRRSVMELVDNHDVEVIWLQGFEVVGVEALNRCKDMLKPGWTCTANPLLTERCLAERVSERGEALIENLLAVGDEKQPSPVEPPT